MVKTCILKLRESFLKCQHLLNLQEGEPTSWFVFYIYKLVQVYSISSVNSVTQSSLTLQQAPLSTTDSQSLLEFMSIELMMPSNHLIFCHLFPSPPAFSLSQHLSLFKWVSSSHQVAKGLDFSFRIRPSNGYSGWISIRMNWLNLLALQGICRVFSNTTLQKHQLFTTQLSLQSNSHIHT